MKKMKRKQLIVIVSLCLITIILIEHNISKNRTSREFMHSDEYYEENIQSININEVSFDFTQVKEVENLNKVFYEKYNSYIEVVVEDDRNSELFEKYTNIPFEYGDKYSGIRCYLDANENVVSTYFRYTFVYKTSEDNIVDSSIEICVTDEPMKEYSDLLVNSENATTKNIGSIYDNILYYMENGDMSFFETNLCTVIFDGSKYYYFYGVIDEEKSCYINKYCEIIYRFFQEICI